jgi:hypothetical protein
MVRSDRTDERSTERAAIPVAIHGPHDHAGLAFQALVLPG